MQPALEQYSPDPTLTPIQHHILSLLAQGASIAAAASTAGVHRNTVANWRRCVPAFAREFEFAARERSLFWHDQAAGFPHSRRRDRSPTRPASPATGSRSSNFR